MRRWSVSSFLLFGLTLATAVPAREVDAALQRDHRRQVSLSTGAGSSTTEYSTTTQAPTTTTTSEALASSTAVVTESSTVTSQGSVVVESSTVTQSPSITSSVVVVSSTITRTSTNAQGQTTQVAETVSSTATSEFTYSYSQFVTSSASQIYETYTSIQGGSTVTGTLTSSTLVPVTTSARVTPSALAANGDSSGSSGLSDSSKKIIGGVVGGIGGALLLAGLAYTVWRIWGRKRNLHDEDLYDPNANTEKLSTSTDNNQSAFQSTLDQYHKPGPVNTASNF